MNEKTNTNYSELMFNSYIKEVQRSGMLIPYKEIPTVQKSDLSKVLNNCCKQAHIHFQLCHEELIKLFNMMNVLEANLKNDTVRIENKYSSYEELWHKVFEDFNDNLIDIFNYTHEKIIGSFRQKVKMMNNFTICLFGRTKSGKSTTMEALTCGDGKSIGIGGQNTTKDSKAYSWNGLMVVDTPGIDAMDEVDGLEEIALQYADSADLIIFLMPHQILEGDFEKFNRFYKQNKPIIIILNVKKAIGQKGSMEFKIFLKHPKDIVNEEEVDGYKRRIRSFVLEKLNIEENNIPILSVHSHAAYLSRKEDYADVKNTLFKASRFENLENLLIKEVKEYGELFRIKNPYETVILFSSTVCDNLRIFHKKLSEQQIIFEDYVDKFKNIKATIIKRKSEIINSVFSTYINSKQNAVYGVVNELFNTKCEAKRGKILSDFIHQSQINEKIQRCQNEIKKEIDKEIKNFFNSFSRQINIFTSDGARINADVRNHMNEINCIDSTGNLLGNLSTASSIALSLGTAIVLADVAILGEAGTLFGLGSANFWNPVGWALLAASVGFGIWEYSKKKELQEKIERSKNDTVNKLRTEINNLDNKVNSYFSAWTNQVIDNIQNQHIDIMSEYSKYAKKHLAEVQKVDMFIRNMLTKIKKMKFESLLISITDKTSLTVRDVVEKERNILIHINTLKDIDTKTTETVLSRVEEKQVKLIGDF